MAGAAKHRTTRRRTMVGRGAGVALSAMIVSFAGSPPVFAQELEVVPPAVRNVTPPGILPGPTVDGPLYRIPKPPPPPVPPSWKRFHLPRTTDGATFITKSNVEIRVLGIEAPAVDQSCTRADGEVWPCGRTALFSLRMFLRGRAVECFVPSLDGVDRAIAPCRVGQIDLGRWLVRQGWATPNDDADEALKIAAREARCERLGMWRGTVPDPSCPPQTAEPLEPDAPAAQG